MLIYALLDPKTDEVRYVGKTHRTAHRRLRRHLAPTHLRGNSYKERWLRSLLKLGLEPGILVVEQCITAEHLCERERFWVAHYKSLGARLTNATEGGDGGSGPHTEETREKIRRALLGKPKTEEHRRRSSSGHRGLKATDATREKLRRLHSARPRQPWSEDYRNAMSRAKRGRPFTDQHGNRYETQKGAARLLGINVAHLNEVLHGKRNRVKGYIFKFVEPDLRVQEFPR